MEKDKVDYEFQLFKEELKEIVTKDEAYNFGKSVTISIAGSTAPLMIGNMVVDENHRLKCLIVTKGYKAEILEHQGNQIIVLRKI